MKAKQMNIKPLVLALFAAGILSACGGGGGGGDDSTVGGVQNPPGNGGSSGGGGGGDGGGGGQQAPTLTMSCPDGAAPENQCSGGTILKTDNGVILTQSGVQVYGISTSDLAIDPLVQADPVPAGVNLSNPSGFALPSAATAGSVAEIRLQKNATTNALTRMAMLLNGFGLSWDGTNPRPPIIETFMTERGRVGLDATTRALVLLPLPAGTDTTFFSRTAPVPAANYANNTYFPTTAPVTNLMGALDGGWRTNGPRGDFTEKSRDHQDGDLDAPTATAAAGTKGFRSYTNISYEFANITTWASQDTVNLAQFLTQPKIEHNKERRGVVAFGNVTSPDAVPTTGTATYSGTVYGLLGLPAPQDDPQPFVGNATVTVDYATGTATIAIANAETFEATPVAVDVAEFTATATKGTVADTAAPNYFTGAVNATGVTGGVSGRYFGPSAKEVGGTFQLAGPNNSVVIGGFVARKP